MPVGQLLVNARPFAIVGISASCQCFHTYCRTVWDMPAALFVHAVINLKRFRKLFLSVALIRRAGLGWLHELRRHRILRRLYARRANRDEALEARVDGQVELAMGPSLPVEPADACFFIIAFAALVCGTVTPHQAQV